MTESSATAGDQQEILKLDTDVPQTARIWNYLLGGKDNFAFDRAVGDQIIRPSRNSPRTRASPGPI